MGWAKGALVEMSIVTDAPSTRQIWMDNVNCPAWPSTETHIEQCTHNNHPNYVDSTNPVGNWKWGTNTNSCTHAKDIGVGCDLWTTDGGAMPWSTRSPPTPPTTTKENA